ncbi:MAG: prohibitin family protein [Clostridia bacterium]|nr:prohibitin family protein [Clostridia bacterium]
MSWFLGILFFILAAGAFACIAIDSKIAKILGGIGGALFSLLFIFIPFSIRQVDAGQVAVVKIWGDAKEVRTSGMHFDFWLSHKYERYDAKVQQATITTQAYSSDGQTMDIELIIQYQIQVDNVLNIAKNYGGLEMLQNRIETIATEKMKSTLSQKSAMTIIETRANVSPDVESAIRSAITNDYYVNITSVVLTDISFTDAFEKTVEDKMIAEQEKLKAEYEKEKAIIQAEQELEVAKKQAEAQLEKAKKEAESELVLAEAEAEALEIMNQAWEGLSAEVKQAILNEMAIEKWDGKLPETMVGDDFLKELMNFINSN